MTDNEIERIHQAIVWKLMGSEHYAIYKGYHILLNKTNGDEFTLEANKDNKTIMASGSVQEYEIRKLLEEIDNQ